MTEYEGLDIKDLRERLAENGDIHALQEAGLLDERTIQKLLSYKRSYEPNSAPHYDDPDETAYYARNTRYWRETVERELSENLRRAVQNGNWQVISFALGRGSQDEQVRLDFVDYEKFRSIMREPGLVLLMYGGMGSGKTMTSCRAMELWMSLYPNGRVLTNIQSLAELHDRLHYVASFPELVETAAENPEQHTLLLLDELGVKGTAYGGQVQEAMQKVMHRFTRLMRKEPYKLQIIGIAQRSMDIHPTLRNDEIAYYAYKEGSSKKEKQKHMVVYDSMDDGTVDADSSICGLRGIGMPRLKPDTNDKATWDWGSPEEWVETGLVEWDDLDQDPPDDSDGDEQRVKCRGEKTDGDDCSQRTTHESGYCDWHRDQWDRDSEGTDSRFDST